MAGQFASAADVANHIFDFSKQVPFKDLLSIFESLLTSHNFIFWNGFLQKLELPYP